MFTGIITDIGTVLDIQKTNMLHCTIQTNYHTDTIALGVSIACDGVCLTVTDKGILKDNNAYFKVDISSETLSKTNINQWIIGRKINLERALKLGDELGGHIVQGHVDGFGIIQKIYEEQGSWRFEIEVSNDIAPFIAEKGSVTINGISLTVNKVDGCVFDVNIIPHTMHYTTMGFLRVNDKVNIEIDVLARYMKRLITFKS
jgi:riboflavin synthase